MWSLREKEDGTVYLTYDRDRRYNGGLRGSWELVGMQDKADTAKAVRFNRSIGLLCVNDNEGGVRVLVLEE